MAKAKSKARKRANTRAPKAPRIRAPARASAPSFGPISTVSTAPVAIGNSLRGVKATVLRTGSDSVRVVGRDFAYTPAGTGTATGWALAGGMPLTPAALQSSILRGYVQMYNKFKFNSVAFTFITSSATSTTGDVMFQCNANRSDPCANTGATTFLPYALSHPGTIIGPQWTNHRADIQPRGPVRTLVLGSNSDVDYQAQGEVMLYTKTATGDSPGYVLIDYDVTFHELAINPKSGLLPNPNIPYFPAQLVWPTTALTSATTVVTVNEGTNWLGGTDITGFWANPNTHAGDIFKCVFDVTNSRISTWTVSAGSTGAALLLDSPLNGASTNNTVVDGFTCYLVASGATGNRLYATLTEAFTSTNPFVAGNTYTPVAYAAASSVPTAGVWMFCQLSFVGTVNASYLQQQ
jgi:hypothetical protein